MTDDEVARAAEALADSPPRMLVVDALADPLDRARLGTVKALTTRLKCWTVVVAADRAGLDSGEVVRAQAAWADLILSLEREDMYDKESPRAGEADICITRSRATPTGTLTVAAQLHYGRFVDITPAPGPTEPLW